MRCLPNPLPRKTLWTFRYEFIADKKTTFKKDGTPLDGDTIKSYENVAKEFLKSIQCTIPTQITAKHLKWWTLKLRSGYGTAKPSFGNC